VKNILAGLSADGQKTRHMPLRVFAMNEKSLHHLSMLAADVLAAFAAESLAPTDLERTSVLYRMLAHLANRRSLKISKALRQRVLLTAAYIARHPAHLTSDISFNDLYLMARHAPRDPRRSTSEDRSWASWTLHTVVAPLEISLALALGGFAVIGFCSVPLLIVTPGAFRAASVEGWRALLAPPACAGDCRVPIPPHGRRGMTQFNIDDGSLRGVLTGEDPDAEL
jgi:hypothetical protein